MTLQRRFILIFLSLLTAKINITEAECSTPTDLVKSDKAVIKYSEHEKDLQFDNRVGINAANHQENTVDRMYITDRVGFFNFADKPWVTFTFDKEYDITEILIKGVLVHEFVAFIKTYTIQYKTTNDAEWQDFTDGKGKVKVFKGNSDERDVGIPTKSAITLKCKELKIVPLEFKRCCPELNSLTKTLDPPPVGHPELTPPYATGWRIAVMACGVSVTCDKVVDVVMETTLRTMKVSTAFKDRELDTAPGKVMDHLYHNPERLYITDKQGYVTYADNVYVEVDLNKAMDIVKIETTGGVNRKLGGYVQKYRILTMSADSTEFKDVGEFDGNTDLNTLVSHNTSFHKIIKLRLEGITYKRCCKTLNGLVPDLSVTGSDDEKIPPPYATGLRVAIYGCAVGDTTPDTCWRSIDLIQIPDSDIKTSFHKEDPILDTHRDKSDEVHVYNNVKRLNIADYTGWMTYASDVHVTLTLARPYDLYMVITGGGVNHLTMGWVKSYKLLYKTDTGQTTWKGMDKVYEGNKNEYAVNYHTLALKHVVAVRFQAVEVHRGLEVINNLADSSDLHVPGSGPPDIAIKGPFATALRLGVFGCPAGDVRDEQPPPSQTDFLNFPPMI